MSVAFYIFFSVYTCAEQLHALASKTASYALWLIEVQLILKPYSRAVILTFLWIHCCNDCM